MFELLMLVARGVVVAGLAFAGTVALTHWAVRAGHLQPFGAFPRAVRRLSDPTLKPIEQRLLRAGGNPQHAPVWLLAGVVVAGLLLLSGIKWLAGLLVRFAYVLQAGPAGWLVAAVDLVFQVLIVALLVRVISSWFGVSPYAKWMRPVRALTDWLLEPLSRIVPPIGFIDITPIVAYLALSVARWALLNLVSG